MKEGKTEPAHKTIEVMDSTLRDGEQMQDGSYTSGEKQTIAKLLLEEVGVNRVEIGSARVSQGEEEAVREVIQWARESGYADSIEVLGLTDGTVSVDWISDLGATVMNLLAKGSAKHLTKQLRKTPRQHIDDIRRSVESAGAKNLTCNVYLEDWSNGMLESRDYVHELIDELQSLPIRRIMLPDTLGVLYPSQVSSFIAELCSQYPDTHFDFHAHNDYGLATANTVAAVEAGALGVHTTVNGVGERAGNTPLDEVVVCLHDFLGIQTSVNEKKLYYMSETVEIFSGHRVAHNKPICGIHVFTHTAGIHADGDRKANLYANRLMPERFSRKRQYALGKMSGKSNLEYNLKELRIDLTEEQKKLVLERIIMLGDRKARITQDDLPYIIADILEMPEDRRFLLKSCVVVSSLGLKPMATVKLAVRKGNTQEYDDFEENAQGDGGYDAIVKAIKKITAKLNFRFPELADYEVSIPSGGMSDALVQCSITWKDDTTFVTRGVNSDQVIAAAEATEKMLNLVAKKA